MARDRSLSVKLRADVSNYLAGMEQAGSATREFSSRAGEGVAKHKADWAQVGQSVTVAGLAIAAGVGLAVSRFADFDQAMSAASAATRATSRDLAALREAAMQAGADTQYSATEAAQAITELGKAGLSTADILGGGLTGALSLAAAGQMDVAEAAELSAVAMKQFGLGGDKVSHVADLLAAGAGKAVGSVEDMGMALKQSGLVAAQTGVSIEETTGTLAAFASAGLIGSDAGTSFKTMLQRLNPQSKEAADAMEALGISAYNSQGEFVGMSVLAGQLKGSLSKLSAEQRNAALATIFGSDAVRAAAVLYDQGADGIAKWTRDVNDSGFAADQAARLTDNLSGDLERLGGSLDTALIKSGSGANDALRGLSQGLESAVNWFSRLPAPVQTGAVQVGAASAAVLLLGGGSPDCNPQDPGLQGRNGRHGLDCPTVVQPRGHRGEVDRHPHRRRRWPVCGLCRNAGCRQRLGRRERRRGQVTRRAPQGRHSG
ncbi:MAG: phage tail tape measure protein [Comamonadaceae bacterium]|nr:phage tail tape measure protein [Comamonadaceae bacterium]